MTTSLKWLATGMVVVGLNLFIANPGSAGTYSTNSFSDAFVTTGPSANLSGNNYGGAGALGISAPGLSKGEFQSVLQFDLAGARSSFNQQYGAGQWSVQSLTLQFTATAPNNAIFNTTAAGQFQVYRMQNGSFTEGTGTPAAPTTTGITFTTLQSTFISAGDESLGTFSFNGSTSGAATYTLTLDSDLSADVLSGNVLSLRLAAADTAISYLFDSRNFGTAGSRPDLTIDAIPEPGTVSLLGGAMVLVFGRGILAQRRKP